MNHPPESMTADSSISPSDYPLAPDAPLSFEELRRRYNYKNTLSRKQFFAHLLIREMEHIPTPRAAMDIGCGRGMGRTVNWNHEVRKHVQEFWGLEPDDSVTPEQGLFDHVLRATMEDAELPESHFDIAYSCMVMEHVEHPEPFFQAVYRCLKPGGRYYFMTPNGRHYFGLITTAMHRLHLDEIALRLACGKQRTDVYHYPVQYRCNTPKSVTTAAVNAGFEPPEFVFAEQVGPTPYFRGPLRLFVKAMDLKRRVIRKPECLLDMIVRVTKPATPST